MECLRRWATLYLLTYLSLHVANGFCQNIPLVRTPPEVLSQPQAGNSEVTQKPSQSQAKLINALFSYATAKGLLPKTIQIILSTPPVKLPIATSQDTPKTLNDVSFRPKITSNCDVKPSVSSTPAFMLNPILNQISPPTTSYSQTMMLQPSLETEPVSWTFSPKSQMGYVDNFVGAQPCQTISVNPISNQVAPPTIPYSQTMMLQPTLQSESVSWAFSPKTSQMGYIENFSSAQPSQTLPVNPISNQVSPPTTSYSKTMMLQPTLETETISWTYSPKTSQIGYVENFAGTQPSQIVSTNLISSQVSPLTAPYSQTMMLQPTSETETISWTFSPKPSQMGNSENFAGAQPSQTVWQSLQQATSINNYLQNEQVICNEATSPCGNLQISSPTYTLISTSNTGYRTVENVYETNCGVLMEEPVLVTRESDQTIPISLKINIPSPNDQCSTITNVNPAVANPECMAAYLLYSLPPPPPIIMKRSRSSCLRKLLPFILLALIDDSECCRGFDCSCNCDSDDPIPIPYPIPVSVNSPMVNVGCNCPYSSRNRE